VRQVGDLTEDHIANSTASIVIKPSIAFNRGDTFVFGSWVCTADGAGSFQRYLTMTSDPETGLVTLPEATNSSKNSMNFHSAIKSPTSRPNRPPT
jgi:hypothetical protein